MKTAIRDHHTAFACGDNLIAIKAETPHGPKASDLSPSIFSAVSLTGIFDHGNSSAMGKLENFVHVSRVPIEMDDDDDGPGPTCNGFFYSRWIEVPGIGDGIDKDGRGATISHRIGGSNKG